MKTFIFSALALGMLASCANTDVEGVVENGEPVAIQLSAGVQQNVVVSRAPITGAGTSFDATIFGWEVVKDATVDYTAASTWKTTTSENISANASNEEISLTEIQYYNAVKTTTTYMKAYYPAGTITTGEYNFTADAKKDGTQDILVSNELTGSRADAVGKIFTFTHPLTQLKFAVKKGEGWKSDAAVSVKSITINGASIATGIKLKNNELITEAAALLTVNGITSVNLPNTSTPIGDPVMIVPTTADKKITVDIVMSDDIEYKGVELSSTGGGTFDGGKAYTVTLTFTNKKVATGATVTDWDYNNTVEIPVE